MHFFPYILGVLRRFHSEMKYQILFEISPLTLKDDSSAQSTSNGNATKADTKKNPNLRVDLLLRSLEDPNQVIAIVEIKRTGLIRKEDFESLPKSTEQKVIQQTIQAADTRRKNYNPRVRVPVQKDNATWHMKQITACANCTHCPYVALFSWDHILLCEYLTDARGRALTRDHVDVS